MRTLTLSTLADKGACFEQCAKFKALFGSSVEITPELCAKYAQDFDWDWAANNLLYPSARAEYKRVSASAWAEYDRVSASARAEYTYVRALAWANAYIGDVA